LDQDGQLDRIDHQIIDALSRDGRLPITELAQRVGLSKTPCQVRLKRLREAGVIRGFRAILDPGKLGRDHIAFVEVKLTSTTERALAEFNHAVTQAPEIEQAHMIAGAFDYLLKVRTADIKAYRKTLGEVVSALPHVGSTSTHISMEAVKDSGF
jgi:Lrp/AsnC family leucine-responsive transcriptional regulator